MIPKSKALMFPLLSEAAAEEGLRLSTDLVRKLSIKLDVTFEDRLDATRRNKSPGISARVQYALRHLAKFGLVEKMGRGHYRITPQGQDALASNAMGPASLQERPTRSMTASTP